MSKKALQSIVEAYTKMTPKLGAGEKASHKPGVLDIDAPNKYDLGRITHRPSDQNTSDEYDPERARGAHRARELLTELEDEDNEINYDDELSVYWEGWDSFEQGRNRSDNSYVDGTKHFDEWDRGWVDAARDLEEPEPISEEEY